MKSGITRTLSLILGTSMVVIFCSAVAHGFHAYLDEKQTPQTRMITSEDPQ